MKPETSEARACPVCKSTGGRRILHRQRFHEGLLGDGYDVVVCGACGAGFADGIPAQEELDCYYTEQSKYTYDAAAGAESPYDYKRFEIIADQVESCLSDRGARILDIGCATGGLLSVFKRRGFARILGADPSPACSKAARRLHGVEMRAATLAQLAGWDERFDVILLVGVLEHLREVQAAVRIIAGRLAPGGLLYCAVPDVEGLPDCRNAPYQHFSMEHVNFFSKSSLDRVMTACDLIPQKSWRWMIEWREGVTEPILSGVYSSTPSVPHSLSPSPPSAKVPGSKSQVSGATAPPVVVPKVGRSAARITATPPPPSSSILDCETTAALERYIALCREQDKKLQAIVEELVRTREPVLVWGAGALARRLLADTRLAEANIAAFVDSNPHLQGTQLAGRSVLNPETLPGRAEPILICSKAFEREIVQTIREKLRLPNRVIVLG